jgi:hypothetical protein
MTAPTLRSDTRHGVSRPLLERPLPGWCFALGWLAASVLFVALVMLLGGPTPTDSMESTFTVQAIGHGQLSCAYPSGNTVGFPFIAPLYPLLSGGVEALTRIGHNVGFPSPSALGPNCSTAMRYAHIYGSVPTLWIGFLGWIALMAGVIAVLRACGRGRCGWELAAVILIACLPPACMTLSEFFHPQDMLAMGLTLGGLALVRRDAWVWAGVLLGLAITSQQFALLVLAPLVVVAPRNRRIRFVGSAIACAALIDVPMVAITSGRALRSAILGSDDGATAARTLIGVIPIHGPLLIESRLLPIILAMMLAWWATRRLGSSVLGPLPLVSLIATSLSFRLVFDQYLYGYYFMALAVALVLLDVIRGRISMYLVGWLALVALAFDALPWGFDPLSTGIPLWIWQIVLVGSGIVLAVSPITSAPAVGGRVTRHTAALAATQHAQERAVVMPLELQESVRPLSLLRRRSRRNSLVPGPGS